jgi:hypothetical protein
MPAVGFPVRTPEARKLRAWYLAQYPELQTMTVDYAALERRIEAALQHPQNRKQRRAEAARARGVR